MIYYYLLFMFSLSLFAVPILKLITYMLFKTGSGYPILVNVSDLVVTPRATHIIVK